MKKLSLLAALLIATSTVYGAGNASNYSNSNPNTNSGSNSTMRHNQSNQSRTSTGRYLAANDDRYANSDQKLAKDIRDKLSSGLFSKGYEQVSVDVRNGDVTLSGSVQTQSDKDKVEKEIRNVNGVRSLTSKISVVDTATTKDKASAYIQDSYATPADQQLNLKIRDKITGWFWNSYPEVFIDTANGVVVLEGFVVTPKEQQDLMMQIRKIEGVKGVKSNLKIKNQN